MKYIYLIILSVFFVASAQAQNQIDDFQTKLKKEGDMTFSAENGDAFWHNSTTGPDGKPRSCTTCHGDDLTKAGQHATTKKVIDPMAPSVNAERFTDEKKMKKWFLRNCKWTVGRECTAQEKGDVLQYLKHL